MDGNCGTQNKGLKCGGKWGSCCSTAGKCGTGEAFCGVNKCQSGNCTMIIPNWSETTTSKPVAVPTPTVGSISTDSSCGGTNIYQCKGFSFGDRCSSFGFCGNSTGHCDIGCQANFGTCSTKSTLPICFFDQAKGEYVCPTVSTDTSCGGKQGFTCQGSTFGACCSVQGFCGSTGNHCAQGR